MITTCKLDKPRMDRLFEWWMASGPGAFAITTNDTQPRKKNSWKAVFL